MLPDREATKQALSTVAAATITARSLSKTATVPARAATVPVVMQPTPTAILTRAATATPTLKPTQAPMPSPTSTIPTTPTNTPTATATVVPTDTATATPVPTPTSTATPLPTDTATPHPSDTPVPEPTQVPTLRKPTSTPQATERRVTPSATLANERTQAAEACFLLTNHMSRTVTLTFTSRDQPWHDTFEVTPTTARYRYCLEPGRYTVTASAPSAKTFNGEFAAEAGDQYEWPLYLAPDSSISGFLRQR